MGPLADTVVAITGASSGIGRATARELVNAGANVILGARRLDRLEALETELGSRAVAVRMDVRDPADARHFVETAIERFGRIDSLVVNAGVGAYGGILDHSDEFLAEMVDTNVNGSVWVIRAAVAKMLPAGRGDIIVVASVAGFRGGANEGVYTATKYAQVGLAASIDKELRSKGIRVTTISPAATATEFAMGKGRSEDMPTLPEFLQPEDVAAAIRTVLEQPRRMRTQHWSMFPMLEDS
ncbi:MAG: SDR family oxidoreductase [Chloroflexota bacterium]